MMTASMIVMPTVAITRRTPSLTMLVKTRPTVLAKTPVTRRAASARRPRRERPSTVEARLWM
jgi:hypothetical protein